MRGTHPCDAHLVASQPAGPNSRNIHDSECYSALPVSLEEYGDDSSNSTRPNPLINDWSIWMQHQDLPHALRQHLKMWQKQQQQHQNASHPRIRQSPGGFQSVLPQDEGSRMMELSSIPLSRTESCPLPGPAAADAPSKGQFMRRQHSVHFPLLPFLRWMSMAHISAVPFSYLSLSLSLPRPPPSAGLINEPISSNNSLP